MRNLALRPLALASQAAQDRQSSRCATTLGTGALPGTTGMVGYSVLNPMLGGSLPVGTTPHPDQNLNLITWEGRAPDPRAWQDVPTIFERLERLERGPDRSRSAREGGAPWP